jgi:hypothetical protein
MSTATVIDASEPDTRFDFGVCVDKLRTHSTGWLRSRDAELEREKRRIDVEQLAVRRVLDERNALGVMPDPQVSASTARAALETARALESLPQIAAAAHAGEISADQLRPLVEIATPESDAEWARRGSNVAPNVLQRMARRARKVSADDAAARHAARSVTTWREPDSGMGSGKWRLADIDGVLVEKVLDHMAERMRPEPGTPWDTLAHRKADALVQLAKNYADTEPTGRFRIEIVNISDPNAKAVGPEIEGIPLAVETLVSVMPNAKVRECVVDETGRTRTIRRPRAALPADVERQVRRRDPTCRVPGCTETRRLQIHHLNPVVHAGDSHEPRDLAAVCPHHHHMLVPHGPYRLVGDPCEPDGLRLVHRDDMARDGPST